MFKHVFCDFDGTLVDSSDGILDTLQKCIDRERLSVLVAPTRSLIGPPLRSMIATVLGSEHPAIANVEAAFRTEYDERGYLLTRPFPGIQPALSALHAEGTSLHIVTNKRLIPVQRILNTLGWNDYFLSVSTLDSTMDAKSKSDVLAQLIAKFAMPLQSAIMVGDSLDDRLAADANHIIFAWASWGYGDPSIISAGGFPLGGPEDLVRRVLYGGASLDHYRPSQP